MLEDNVEEEISTKTDILHDIVQEYSKVMDEYNERQTEIDVETSEIPNSDDDVNQDDLGIF